MLWLMNALKSEMFVQSYDGRNLINRGNQKVCQVANGLPLCRFVAKTSVYKSRKLLHTISRSQMSTNEDFFLTDENDG